MGAVMEATPATFATVAAKQECKETSRKKEESLFAGQWAPTFIILGLYNKIVKELGSDHRDRAS